MQNASPFLYLPIPPILTRSHTRVFLHKLEQVGVAADSASGYYIVKRQIRGGEKLLGSFYPAPHYVLRDSTVQIVMKMLVQGVF